MTKKQYQEALKDPRWNVVRIAVLNRDKITCTNCGGKDKILHVHHKRYIDGRMPWQYPLNFLTTLCGDCHFKLHKENPNAGHEIVKRVSRGVKSKKKRTKRFYSDPAVWIEGKGLVRV